MSCLNSFLGKSHYSNKKKLRFEEVDCWKFWLKKRSKGTKSKLWYESNKSTLLYYKYPFQNFQKLSIISTLQSQKFSP